jgi:GxxExxY protein
VLAEKNLTEGIIGAAIDVHRELGPGLLESAYEECLCYELLRRDLRFERQKPLPIIYKGVAIDCSYRLDIVVEGVVIVELKSVESLSKLHEAQVLTYLKLSGIAIGLLINFNVVRLTDGLKRFVLGAEE